MLTFLRENKINILLCEKVDRLTRNLKDAVAINDWLEENPERQIHFVKQNLVIHKNARSDDKFRWDIEIVLAKKYIANLSEEVKKGQKEKLAQGGLPTKPPIGYKSIGDKGHKFHVIDETKAPLVRKMFELYSTGNYSLNALVKIMCKEGLRGRDNNIVIKSRMHKLLSNPFYYGKARWNGEIYDCKHEPLISKELFDMVQARLVRKISNPQFKTHLPVFKAKIVCEECGGTITWETQKGHWYGHCNHYRKCSQKKYVRQEKAEDQLFPYFDKVVPKNPRVLDWLKKALKDSHANEINYNTRRRDELSRIITVADKRMEESYKDKLDGRVPAALCDKIIKDSIKEKEDALNSLKKLGKARKEYYEAGFAIHELALKSKEIYQSKRATTEEKRLLLSYVFSNLTQKADRITPNYTLAFEFLVKWIHMVNSTFEPDNYRLDKRKGDTFVSPSPVLLRGLAEVRTEYIISRGR